MQTAQKAKKLPPWSQCWNSILKDSIDGFGALLDGEGDDISEAAFYMTGTLDEAIAEGKRLAMESH